MYQSIESDLIEYGVRVATKTALHLLRLLSQGFQMCGYFGNLHESPVVIDLMNQLGIPLPYPIERAYQRRTIRGLVTANGLTDALWWFALKQEDGAWVPNEKVTSFNARELTKPLWAKAAKTSRSLVFCTEIGEAKGSKKYLLRSPDGFALGCLYKDWVNSDGSILRSFAVITRPPHPRFVEYHEKAFPLFLPLEKSTLRDWLDPTIENSAIIENILENPRIYTDLEVTPVKTYKDAAPIGKTFFLKRDFE